MQIRPGIRGSQPSAAQQLLERAARPAQLLRGVGARENMECGGNPESVRGTPLWITFGGREMFQEKRCRASLAAAFHIGLADSSALRRPPLWHYICAPILALPKSRPGVSSWLKARMRQTGLE